MTQLLCVLALVALVIRLGYMVALHVVPSPYHPVRHAFSDYAVGPTRPLTLQMSVFTVISWFALAGAVWATLPTWSYQLTAVLMLVALGVIAVIITRAPTDLEGEASTSVGKLHYVLAISWFALAYSLTGDISRLATERWPGALASTLNVVHWVALASLIGLCVCLVAKPLRPVFGLVERVFLFAIAVFYPLFAALLLMHS